MVVRAQMACSQRDRARGLSALWSQLRPFMGAKVEWLREGLTASWSE